MRTLKLLEQKVKISFPDENTAVMLYSDELPLVNTKGKKLLRDTICYCIQYAIS